MSNEDKKEPKELKQELQWYKTVSGKKILVNEHLSAKKIDSFKSVNKLEDGSLIFHFELNYTNFISLDIISQKDHPKTFPRILAQVGELILPKEGKYMILNEKAGGYIELLNEKDERFRELSEDVKKLKEKWETREISNVSEIAKRLIKKMREKDIVIFIDPRCVYGMELSKYQWYKKDNGKKRLKEEIKQLKNLSLDFQIRKLDSNKRLSISVNNFKVNQKNYIIEFILPLCCPKQLPEISIDREGETNKVHLQPICLSQREESPFLVQILDDISKMITSTHDFKDMVLTSRYNPDAVNISYFVPSTDVQRDISGRKKDRDRGDEKGATCQELIRKLIDGSDCINITKEGNLIYNKNTKEN
jgi:molybdopterin converting factor small subunit